MKYNEHSILTPNFDFVSKRNEKRNSSFAIYHNTAVKSHMITLHRDTQYQAEGNIVSNSIRIGDLCAVEYQIRINPDRESI